jgi:hypothetical protein
MIIYDFYSNRTSGPIVDYLCTLIPYTKLIDYQLIDVNNSDDKAKLFTFGSEGEVYHMIVTKDDDVKISIGYRLSSMIKQNTREDRELFRDNLVVHLTKVARDYKIKQVID